MSSKLSPFSPAGDPVEVDSGTGILLKERGLFPYLDGHSYVPISQEHQRDYQLLFCLDCALHNAYGPNFEMAFRLFHGRDGIVPLSARSFAPIEKLELEPAAPQFNPLAAKAATISLSGFGGPFIA